MNLASAHSSSPSLPPLSPIDFDAPGQGLFDSGAGQLMGNAARPRRRPRFTLFSLSFLRSTSLLTESPPWGFFSGPPKVDFLHADRRLRVLEDFCYTDPHGRTWLAPAGSVVDTLTISNAFWSLVGETLAGPYLMASIIHDAACDQESASWRDAHLAFYHALRCGGAEEKRAKLLYYAAYHFGPRWGLTTACAEILSALGLTNENHRPFVDAATATAIAAWVEAANPDLATLQVTTHFETKSTGGPRTAPATLL